MSEINRRFPPPWSVEDAPAVSVKMKAGDVMHRRPPLTPPVVCFDRYFSTRRFSVMILSKFAIE
jgi:hypothetical protein